MAKARVQLKRDCGTWGSVLKVCAIFFGLCGLATAKAQNTGAAPQTSSPPEEVAPAWNPGSNLYLSGGLHFMPSKEQSRWSNRKPSFAQLTQAFTLAEASGEWDLGGGLLYVGASGKKDKPDDNAKDSSVTYNYFAIGLMLTSSYRFAPVPHPVIAPRVGVFGGVALQNQSTLQADYTIKKQEFYKPIAGVRAALEFSLLAMNPTERGLVGYGYGVDDFVLTLGGTYLMDLKPKESYRTGGMAAEVGLGFLFP